MELNSAALSSLKYIGGNESSSNLSAEFVFSDEEVVQLMTSVFDSFIINDTKANKKSIASGFFLHLDTSSLSMNNSV
jgi:hypothetical protein